MESTHLHGLMYGNFHFLTLPNEAESAGKLLLALLFKGMAGRSGPSDAVLVRGHPGTPLADDAQAGLR